MAASQKEPGREAANQNARQRRRRKSLVAGNRTRPNRAARRRKRKSVRAVRNAVGAAGNRNPPGILHTPCVKKMLERRPVTPCHVASSCRPAYSFAIGPERPLLRWLTSLSGRRCESDPAGSFGSGRIIGFDWSFQQDVNVVGRAANSPRIRTVSELAFGDCRCVWKSLERRSHPV